MKFIVFILSVAVSLTALADRDQTCDRELSELAEKQESFVGALVTVIKAEEKGIKSYEVLKQQDSETNSTGRHYIWHVRFYTHPDGTCSLMHTTNSNIRSRKSLWNYYLAIENLLESNE